ncbi:MAG: hypothetical protein ACFFDI_14355 [Promethearchaeota archaeon]
MMRKVIALLGVVTAVLAVSVVMPVMAKSEGNSKIRNKWDLSGDFVAHPGYNWAGQAEGATWTYQIHIKEAMYGDDSVGSIHFMTGDIDVVGHVEATKRDYAYWAGDDLAAVGKADYNDMTYYFMFLYAERAVWFALSTTPYDTNWAAGTVWGGGLRAYQLHSEVPDGGFTLDYKAIHNGEASSCTTIQDGTLTASTGEVLTTGYDIFGYDYQAHMFNGRYCDYDRDLGGEYCEDNLIMKWNDAWLSNKSCDGDDKLDRHYGYDSYIGSGAWLTNHQVGDYEGDDKICHWTYFVKIVAAPADAEADGGVWYAADDTEIGPVIWGAFAIIEEVYNDPCEGTHGVQYKSPAGPGFGKYMP